MVRKDPVSNREETAEGKHSILHWFQLFMNSIHQFTKRWISIAALGVRLHHPHSRLPRLEETRLS